MDDLKYELGFAAGKGKGRVTALISKSLENTLI